MKGSGLKRRTVFRMLAVSLSVALVWIGLELLAAFHWINWRTLFDRVAGLGEVNHQYKTGFLMDAELEFRRPPQARWSGLAAGDIELEWSVPPAQPRLLTFAYDRRGYRNSTDLDQASVVLLGDSFVEGWFVNEPETVAKLLETELKRPVANLGVAGYGTKQELLVLQREGLRLRPTLIAWFFFEGNDLYEDFRFERTLRSLAMDQAADFIPGQPVIQERSWPERSWTGNLLRLLRAWSHPYFPNQAPYFGQLSGPGLGRTPIYFAPYASVPWSDWHAERWRQTQICLADGARYCREKGVRLLVCYVPTKFRVCRPFVEIAAQSPCAKWTLWTLPEEFAAFCIAAGIPCLDLTGPLRESVRTGGMPYPPQDSHWGPEGHRLVARVLRDEIRRRGWLPDAP